MTTERRDTDRLETRGHRMSFTISQNGGDDGESQKGGNWCWGRDQTQ